MKLKAVVAVNKDDMGIGFDNTIPWHIPDEFKHFKETTMGDCIIMGRKTFESLPSVLPGRHHIVIANNRFRNYDENVTVVHSEAEALELVDTETAWVIGGGAIYNLFIDKIEELVMSTINENYVCNKFFPRGYYWINKNFVITQTKHYKDFSINYYKRLLND